MIEINEVGNRYGNLLVIAKSDKSTRYGIYWICQCDCGNITEIVGRSLRNKKATACGCKKGYNTGPKRTVKNVLLRQHYASYRTSKRAKQLGFELSPEQFETICRQDCYYCGNPPQPRKYLSYRPKTSGPDRYSYDNLNGIDRLDNDKGYIEGNCIPACGKCNHMKKNYTEAEFLEHIRKIYEFSCKST